MHNNRNKNKRILLKNKLRLFGSNFTFLCHIVSIMLFFSECLTHIQKTNKKQLKLYEVYFYRGHGEQPVNSFYEGDWISEVNPVEMSEGINPGE